MYQVEEIGESDIVVGPKDITTFLNYQEDIPINVMTHLLKSGDNLYPVRSDKFDYVSSDFTTRLKNKHVKNLLKR